MKRLLLLLLGVCLATPASAFLDLSGFGVLLQTPSVMAQIWGILVILLSIFYHKYPSPIALIIIIAGGFTGLLGLQLTVLLWPYFPLFALLATIPILLMLLVTVYMIVGLSSGRKISVPIVLVSALVVFAIAPLMLNYGMELERERGQALGQEGEQRRLDVENRLSAILTVARQADDFSACEEILNVVPFIGGEVYITHRRNHCILQVHSLRTNNSLCVVKYGSFIDECYHDAAIELQDPMLCRTVKPITREWQCLTDIARAAQNPLICDSIEDPEVAQACRSNIQ